MALPHASMLTRRCLRLLTPQPLLLSSLPGWDCQQPTGERAAKRRRKKDREGCSLPASSWEERYGGGRLADAATPLWRLPYQEQLQPSLPAARNIVCVRTDHMKNIPLQHKQVAQCYEQFIRRSPLGSCILFHEGGHWRELVVRTSQLGHTMAIVTFHPQQLGQEALTAQKALLREFFTCGPGAACALTSLYFQESTMTRCSHERSPFQLLHGEPHIFEDVLDLRFRISPDAFFQVIGVEIVQKAIEDARWNAAFNDHRVVKAIRSCKAIRRLLYISCKPEGEAMRNFLE
ncbi:hypothetical protein CIB84_001524 [Bambusicola thoracicus]|uniref:Uncharacterized protein n=1 Tax=Bambusicola thoracicus TaxID=9083 RepID=A0A2P4TEC6_BAMTH|nr:hypothetical protein CIB84_001524 [Bambusicola thoracicus]